MATGDSGDLLARLKSLIPRGWFAYDAPNRDAVLGGFTDALAGIYNFINFAKLQARIGTTKNWFVDLVAYDFFGLRILRRTAETDAAFQVRIIKEIFRQRVTRAGVIQAISDQTGQAPQFFEPWNPADTGGLGDGSFSLGGLDAVPDVVTAIGFNGLGELYFGLPGYGPGGYSPGSGFLGSLHLPFQEFIIAYRPSATFVAQYGPVSDSDIYANVAATTAAGVTSWVWIQNPSS